MPPSLITTPNAWIADAGSLSFFLDRAFTRSRGHIWLFDNDLELLESQDGSFDTIYIERVDGYLADKILSVKILVDEEHYARFSSPQASDPLTANLLRLRNDRLKTFYVGNLSDIPESLFGKSTRGRAAPLIIYSSEDGLDAGETTVLVRPFGFPFKYVVDGLLNQCVAWSTPSQATKVLNTRLKRSPLESIFIDNYLQYFKSIEPVNTKVASGSTANDREKAFFLDTERQHASTTIHLITPRSLQEVGDLAAGLRDQAPNRHKSPQHREYPIVTPPVDCLIITALPEEKDAVLRCIDSFEHLPGGSTSTGWIHVQKSVNAVPALSIGVVVEQLTDTGSVHSALTTRKLVTRWRPRVVLLVGRCGCVRELSKDKQESERLEGDVLISATITAYEYQKLDNSGTDGVFYNHRQVFVDNDLFRVARHLSHTWRPPDDLLPAAWRETSKQKTRSPKAFEADFLCGCKVVKLGVPWFNTIRERIGKSKLAGIEMEAEGVGEAARDAVGTRFLMIKGISDFADEEKNDIAKNIASLTAARFARDLLVQWKITFSSIDS